METVKPEMKFITEDEFEAIYKPQKNHIDDNASYNKWGYETFGEELEYVLSIAEKEPRRVWTVLDADGTLPIASGYHLVNRMLYIITEVPCPEGQEIEVIDDFGAEMMEENEEEDEDGGDD